MNDRIKQQWWPALDDQAAAKKAAMQGVAAAGFVAVVTTILSLGGWLGLGPGNLIDAALFAGVCFGIRALSRTAAIAGLVLFLFERGYAISQGHNSGGTVMTIFITLMFITSVRGTFSYHALKGPAAPDGLFIPPKS